MAWAAFFVYHADAANIYKFLVLSKTIEILFLQFVGQYISLIAYNQINWILIKHLGAVGPGSRSTWTAQKWSTNSTNMTAFSGC